MPVDSYFQKTPVSSEQSYATFQYIYGSCMDIPTAPDTIEADMGVHKIVLKANRAKYVAGRINRQLNFGCWLKGPQIQFYEPPTTLKNMDYKLWLLLFPHVLDVQLNMTRNPARPALNVDNAQYKYQKLRRFTCVSCKGYGRPCSNRFPIATCGLFTFDWSLLFNVRSKWALISIPCWQNTVQKKLSDWFWLSVTKTDWIFLLNSFHQLNHMCAWLKADSRQISDSMDFTLIKILTKKKTKKLGTLNAQILFRHRKMV